MKDDLTRDAFLGGRLHLWQPRVGYRAGLDPVLLAASVPAVAGQSVLDLGCGVGTAMLCLATRVHGLDLTGVEVQSDYAALAERNAAAANLTADIHCADLRDLPGAVRQRQFDHVMMNPPYFDRDRGAAAEDAGRDLARRGPTPLADWLDVGIRRVAPGGNLTVIQQVARLHDVLTVIYGRLGSVVVQPFAARRDRPPHLILVQARLSGKATFRMASTVVLHAGDLHKHDGNDYTPIARAVLRDGEKLPNTG